MQQALGYAETLEVASWIDELMRWCDQLEAQLAVARDTANSALSATVVRLGA